jgi:hypothetical protein
MSRIVKTKGFIEEVDDEPPVVAADDDSLDLPENEESDDDVSEDAPVAPAVDEKKAKPMVIHLRKGMTPKEHQEFVLKIHKELEENKPTSVTVSTPNWAKDSRPFPLIPGAKRLFADSIDAGMIGCLLQHDLRVAAREMYCIAYANATKEDNNLVFENINPNDVKKKSLASFEKFANIAFGESLPKLH